MRLSRRQHPHPVEGKPIYLNKANSDYEFRARFQLELWRRGQPVHNDIDNECVPDFSCCRGRRHLAPERLREMFVRDPASRRPMMEMFIAELPDGMRLLYDLPGQYVFRLESKGRPQ
jgi:hypothetical protein